MGDVRTCVHTCKMSQYLQLVFKHVQVHSFENKLKKRKYLHQQASIYFHDSVMQNFGSHSIQ